MDEQAIKAEVRLWALECVVCQLYAMIYQMAGDADRSFEIRRDGLLESARKQIGTGLNPAMSNLVSAQLEAAVDRLLLTMQQALLERARSPKTP